LETPSQLLANNCSLFSNPRHFSQEVASGFFLFSKSTIPNWQSLSFYAILTLIMASNKKTQTPGSNHKHKHKIVKVKVNLSWKNMFLYGFLLLFTFFLFAGFAGSLTDNQTVPLSQIISDVKAGNVQKITIEDTKLTSLKKIKPSRPTKKKIPMYTKSSEYAGVPLNKTNVVIKDNRTYQTGSISFHLFLPIILMIAFFYFISARLKALRKEFFPSVNPCKIIQQRQSQSQFFRRSRSR